MGEEGQVINCHNVDAWNQHLQNDKNKLVRRLNFNNHIKDLMHS